MALDGFIGFLQRNIFVVLFYLAVVLFVFIKRKKFQFHFRIIAMYRMNWGIKLMDRIASSYREIVKLFGYISIGIGFTGMVVMVLALAQGLYVLFTRPDAPPAVAPLLPGVHVPGVPESLFIPLVQGLIAIFIVAVIHEFCHGVVARAHNIPVKSTGIVLIGPFFAAFVEPDEAVMKKKSDVVNYSMIAAGPVINIILFFVVSALLFSVFYPAFNAVYSSHEGISFSSITPGSPAGIAGLEKDVLYNSVNGQPVLSTSDFIRVFDLAKPGEEVVVANKDASVSVVAGSRPDDASKPYLGVNLYNRVAGDETFAFSAVSWILKLFSLIALLSLGIGLANLLPIGPIDGGKMVQQALHKIRGEQRGNKTLAKLSIFLLIVVLLLLTPIIKETAKLVIG